MTTGHSEEQLNCAIEASSDLLTNLDRDTTFDEEEIRELLRNSKACRHLSEEELQVVAAYVAGLAALMNKGIPTE